MKRVLDIYGGQYHAFPFEVRNKAFNYQDIFHQKKGVIFQYFFSIGA